MIRTLAAALAASTCIVALATPAAAQTREYNIPAGSLKAALDAYVRQSGRQIVYKADEVRSARSPGVRGQVPADAALAALLDGSGFTTRTDGKLVAIVKAGNDSATGDRASPGPGAARVKLGNGTNQDSAPGTDAGATSDIVVTGTHIRGDNPTVSNIVLDRDYIKSTGATTTDGVLRSLPQNSGAGLTPGSYISPTPGAANVGATATVNLRGLGSDSTLILLNGQRMAPNGLGTATDIGAIPLGAIKRVDVLPDGASAVYGSDAVGGVVNFILDDSFQGLTVSSLYGIATKGGLQEQGVDVSAGAHWNGGNFTAGYEYYNRDGLNSQDRTFSSDVSGITLIPSQKRHSGSLIAKQNITDSLTFSLTSLYSNQTNSYENSIFDQKGRDVLDSISTTGVAAWRINSAWQSRTAFSYSHQQDKQYVAFDAPAYLLDRYVNQTYGVTQSIDGTPFHLPGGPVKIAAGFEARSERLDISGDQATSGHRSVVAGFVEILAPLIGRTDAGTGGLVLDAAVRKEHYSDFGSSTNPKIGLAWTSPQVSIRANWGTTFKAPTLYQIDSPVLAELVDIPDPTLTPGSTARSLVVLGGSKTLRPQTSHFWSGGITFAPDPIPSLKVEVNYYNIRYKSRIEQYSGDIFSVLNNEVALAPLILRNPPLNQVGSILSNSTVYNFLGPDFSGEPYTASDFRTLIYGGNINAASVRTSGIDFHLSYVSQFKKSKIDWHLDGTYIFNLSDKATDLSPYITQLDRLFYTPSLRIRGSAGWQSGPWYLSTALNFTGRYKDTTGSEERPIRAAFPIDLVASFQDKKFLGGVELTLSVANLFDQKPPMVDSTAFAFGANFGYDPANGDPIGRIVRFSLSKHF